MSVDFHGHNLSVVNHNNEPYSPMKPIVESMGLTWQVQHRKLTENSQRWGITEMVIPSKGGKQKAICMPVRKLPAYFATIHPNKVKKEIRDKVIMFQNECDDALWDYWSKKIEPKHQVGYLDYQPLTPAQQRHVQRIVSEKVFKDEYATHQRVYSKIKDHFYVGSYTQIPSDKYSELCIFLGAEPLEGEVIQHKKFNYPLEKSPLFNEVCQMKEWPLVCLDDLDKNKRPQLLPQLLDELKKGNYDIVGAFIEMQALYASRDRLAKMAQAAKQIHDILQDAVFDGRRGERVSLGHSA